MNTVMRVLVNDELDWSRGKRAAHVVHAVLKRRKVRYLHAVRVLNAKPKELDPDAPVVVFEGDRPVATASREPDALVLRVWSRKTEDRNVTAQRAVAAALMWYGKSVDSVQIVSSTTANIAAHRGHIRDAGRTEIDPGTVTAVALDS